MFLKIKKSLAAIALSTLFVLPSQAALVDVELSLVIDVSGSVNADEYNLQMDGYAAAFRDPTVQQNIADSANGIAVNAVFFASNFFTSSLDDFTILTSAAEASAFADVLDNFARVGSGSTDIFDGVNRAVELLLNNGLDATLGALIDVSGDGTDSISDNQQARDNAVANGITVNGLAIGSQSITDFYRDNVIGGPGSFVISASTFEDFENAVVDKLRIETQTEPGPIPEPATYALLLAGLGLLLRKRLH